MRSLLFLGVLALSGCAGNSQFARVMNFISPVGPDVDGGYCEEEQPAVHQRWSSESVAMPLNGDGPTYLITTEGD